MFRISTKTFSLAVLFVTLFLIINSIAGATTPQCDYIDPRYAQAGKTKDVTISGLTRILMIPRRYLFHVRVLR